MVRLRVVSLLSLSRARLRASARLMSRTAVRLYSVAFNEPHGRAALQITPLAVPDRQKRGCITESTRSKTDSTWSFNKSEGLYNRVVPLFKRLVPLIDRVVPLFKQEKGVI
jgi:hypothetical protein